MLFFRYIPIYSEKNYILNGFFVTYIIQIYQYRYIRLYIILFAPISYLFSLTSFIYL